MTILAAITAVNRALDLALDWAGNLPGFVKSILVVATSYVLICSVADIDPIAGPERLFTGLQSLASQESTEDRIIEWLKTELAETKKQATAKLLIELKNEKSQQRSILRAIDKLEVHVMELKDRLERNLIRYDAKISQLQASTNQHSASLKVLDYQLGQLGPPVLTSPGQAMNEAAAAALKKAGRAPDGLAQ